MFPKKPFDRVHLSFLLILEAARRMVVKLAEPRAMNIAINKIAADEVHMPITSF